MPKRLKKPGYRLSKAEVLEVARKAEETARQPPEHPLIGLPDIVALRAAPGSVQLDVGLREPRPS